MYKGNISDEEFYDEHIQKLMDLLEGDGLWREESGPNQTAESRQRLQTRLLFRFLKKISNQLVDIQSLLEEQARRAECEDDKR